MRVDGPILPVPDAPTWSGATWIGQLWVDEPLDPGSDPGSGDLAVRLPHAQGYRLARLLVRAGRERPLGMAEVAVDDAVVSAADLSSALAALPATSAPLAATSDAAHTELTVIVCTRERPESLRDALRGVLDQDSPATRVIVVDNAPVSDATRRVVAQLHDPRISLVTEPVPGLSRARNTGVASARTPWVAFTDDDVIPDPGWLSGIRTGIAAGGAGTACVTGLVPTAELRTPAQAWFDARIGWNRVFSAQVFHRDRPPSDLPLFPFQVGRLGAGANFAARRDVITELGGFDVHLGAGTPSRGGEDIDFFFRLVVAGHTLVYEPSAIVWHRHRESVDDLVSQARGYGSGFSAWVTKTLLSPRLLGRAVVIAAGNARRSRATRRGRDGLSGLAPLREYARPLNGGPALDIDVLAIEHRATLQGPAAYLGSRLRGRRQARRPG